MPATTVHAAEADARALLLVRAAESQPASPLWSAEDRAWATRLARETAGNKRGDDAQQLIERARHALQRLLPRAPALAAQLARRGWHPAWPAWAAALGTMVGLLVDQLGGSQRINLLAPPVWAVVLWNLAVLAMLIAAHLRRSNASAGGLRRGLQRWIEPALSLSTLSDAERPIASAFSAAWAERAATLRAHRAAALLHLTAAALAAGMVGGLYLRGLLLDYRAGWQSTFLSAPQAQAVLDTALAPASQLTGIGVPAVAPLRISAEQPPQGTAADWLHLYAATLLLFVIAPRGALAAWQLRRAAALARHLPLPLDATFAGWLQGLCGSTMTVVVVPHAQAPSPPAAARLQEALARHWGTAPTLDWRTPVVAGDEEQAALPTTGTATSPIVMWVDLASTPEAEAQGRLLETLRAGGAAPLLALDEIAFGQRFAAIPERLQQRRQAWRDFAAAQGVELLFVGAVV